MKTIIELKEALKRGKVDFKFTKKDGTIRSAQGTTNPEIISEFITVEDSDQRESKTHKEKPTDMVVYFDLEKKQFRSFRESQFIGE